MENNINFITQKKENQQKNGFEKDFLKIINAVFYGETMENVRNRIKVEFIKKDDIERIIKQQSIEFINPIQNVIVIKLSKMKYLWISQDT